MRRWKSEVKSWVLDSRASVALSVLVLVWLTTQARRRLMQHSTTQHNAARCRAGRQAFRILAVLVLVLGAHEKAKAAQQNEAWAWACVRGDI